MALAKGSHALHRGAGSEPSTSLPVAGRARSGLVLRQLLQLPASPAVRRPSNTTKDRSRIARALTDRQIESDKARVEALDQSIDELNGRVIHVLSQSRGTSLGPDPESWRRWLAERRAKRISRLRHARNRRWHKWSRRSIHRPISPSLRPRAERVKPRPRYGALPSRLVGLAHSAAFPSPPASGI